jgi:hypothetical protein
MSFSGYFGSLLWQIFSSYRVEIDRDLLLTEKEPAKVQANRFLSNQATNLEKNTVLA